ncbi:MAG: molybdopterin-synthase adenylyltransferase MoeB, partial [Pseudomonadota bacterium]
DYDESPCYRCLYAEADESLDSCAGNGVLAPVPGVIGTLMAVEALKTLARIPVETGQLRLLDASRSDFSVVKIGKREHCETCGTP